MSNHRCNTLYLNELMSILLTENRLVLSEGIDRRSLLLLSAFLFSPLPLPLPPSFTLSSAWTSLTTGCSHRNISLLLFLFSHHTSPLTLYSFLFLICFPFLAGWFKPVIHETEDWWKRGVLCAGSQREKLWRAFVFPSQGRRSALNWGASLLQGRLNPAEQPRTFLGRSI